MDRRTFLAGAGAVAVGTTLSLGGIPTVAAEPAKSKYVIMPDILRTRHHVYLSHEYNWQTISWDNLVRFERGNFYSSTQCASVKDELYVQWLEEEWPADDIPPHIQFGGAIVAGEGDPTFYPRWKEWVRGLYSPIWRPKPLTV